MVFDANNDHTAAFGVIQPAPLETTTRPIPPSRPTFRYLQQHALGGQECSYADGREPDVYAGALRCSGSNWKALEPEN